MSKSSDLLRRLAELPVEAFELSARLDYSENAPVITNRFKTISLKRTTIPTPHAPNQRRSFDRRRRYAVPNLIDRLLAMTAPLAAQWAR